MIMDKLLEFSDAQALTATAASTNSIDLGGDHDVGVGKPLYLVVSFDVALAGTSPTFQASLETDDNTGFASAATIATLAQLSAAAAGTKQWIAVPNTNERYLRAKFTLGGTTPTATVSAFLTSEHPEAWVSVPDGAH